MKPLLNHCSESLFSFDLLGNRSQLIKFEGIMYYPIANVLNKCIHKSRVEGLAGKSFLGSEFLREKLPKSLVPFVSKPNLLDSLPVPVITTKCLFKFDSSQLLLS